METRRSPLFSLLHFPPSQRGCCCVFLGGTADRSRVRRTMAGAVRGVRRRGGAGRGGPGLLAGASLEAGETSSPYRVLGLGWLGNTHGVREKLLALPDSNGAGI